MQNNEEFIALLKSVINENELNTIPGDNLITIYKRARSIDASNNNLDIELSKAINTVLEEIKKRGLSPDTKPHENRPREIPHYDNSSFKQTEADGSSKWVYWVAIPIIVIVIALVVNRSFFSEAPKAPTFDIQLYYNDNKGYYGDKPLEDVARDIYEREGHAKTFGDYDTFKKQTGIDKAIQEDNDRRKPSFLSKLMGAIPFRYDEESIYGGLYRYDRFTSAVERRYGTDEKSFKWVSRPQFRNLQHVRDYMAQWERNRQIWAIEEQNEELTRKQIVQQMQQPTMQQQWDADRKNEELKRKLEDIKDTLDAEKREREFRDIQRSR
jgi:hypothetical protein